MLHGLPATGKSTVIAAMANILNYDSVQPRDDDGLRAEEALDPAHQKRGRMDKHVEMSHCCFLARNYLDVQCHQPFATIGQLLEEADTTPADVAENLMPKFPNDQDADACLRNLIHALEAAREEARRKPVEDQEKKSGGGETA
ncbi:hypothetical protein BT93_I0809 [Corymbia citriodora subsp. variegata]|nr:hypothetical protein BT93_I0809 [Corymbia citriodora subsp. variegata]